jgi:hypothetical protein
MGKNMINMIAEVKFSINNYSLIFYIISLEYRGLAQFVIKEHYTSSLVFLEDIIIIIIIIINYKFRIHTVLNTSLL